MENDDIVITNPEGFGLDLMCCYCGQWFTVSSCLEKRNFCSAKCKDDAKYAYIIIGVDSKVKVVECERNFAVSKFLDNGTNTLSIVFDFLNGYQTNLGIVKERCVCGEKVDVNRINKVASAAFNGPVCGDVVVANDVSLTPLPMFVAGKIVEKINKLAEENKNYEIPATYPVEEEQEDDDAWF